MRGTLLLGILATAVVIGLSTWLALRSREEAPAATEGRGALSMRVESVPVPGGVTGGAIHVAARDPVRATCWGDGSVTIRRGGSVSRIVPSGAVDKFRRVAVLDNEAVFALSNHGGLYDLSRSPPERIPVKGVQSGAEMSADGFTLGIGGESGALHLVYPQLIPTRVRPFDDGDPSITAIAGLRRQWGWIVGRADGTTSLFGARSIDLLVGSFTGAVSAVAGQGFERRSPGGERTDRLVAAADGEGHVLAWTVSPQSADLPLAPARVSATPLPVGSAVIALAILRTSLGATDAPWIAVVHAPARITARGGDSPGGFVDLDAPPHAACTIEDGTAVLVATDAGERIVRFAR